MRTMVVVGIVWVCIGLLVIIFRRPLMRANGRMIESLSNGTAPKAFSSQPASAAIIPGLGIIGIGVYIICKVVFG